MLTVETLKDNTVWIVFDEAGGKKLLNAIEQLLVAKKRDHEHLFGEVPGDDLDNVRMSGDAASIVATELRISFWPKS
ncbi:MAG: hypothetical protein ABL893_21205 [Hyphomicrobium sp.]